jgi:hypothetical protein
MTKKILIIIFSLIILLIIGLILISFVFNTSKNKIVNFNINSNAIVGGYVNSDIDSNLFPETLDAISSLKFYWDENPLYIKDENSKVTCINENLNYYEKEEDNLVYKYCGNYYNLTSKKINPSIGPMEFGPFYDGVISENQCEGDIKDNCYFVLAFQEDSIDYCENIDLINLKERCYYVFAEKENNMKICNLIDGNWGQYNDPKQDCFDTLISRNIEKDNLSLDFCSQIEYDRSKDNCFYNLSIVDNNIEICNLINSSERMQSCISSMLKWSDNRSEIIGFSKDTCQLITEASSKESCFKVLEDNCEWYCYPGSDCRKPASCGD